MKYRSYAEIDRLASEFLEEHHPAGSIPVPIEEIVEFKLGLTIVPHKGLLSRKDIDAFLSSDFTELHIDEDHYMSESNRSRFTLAHEVGHFVMHRNIGGVFRSTQEWKEKSISATKSYYETQANAFAGCLLMPKELALREFKRQKTIAKKKFPEITNDPTFFTYISSQVARVFGVSDQVAEIRLSKLLK